MARIRLGLPRKPRSTRRGWSLRGFLSRGKVFALPNRPNAPERLPNARNCSGEAFRLEISFSPTRDESLVRQSLPSESK